MNNIDLYSKIQGLVKQEIENQISAFAADRQYDVAKIPDHHHNGTDSGQIDPANLLGFPIIATAPTDTPINGVIRLFYNGVKYRLYFRINNTWQYLEV